MHVSRLRTLCIEIFKTVNNLNPIFMKEMFKLRETNRLVREQYMMNLDFPKFHQVTLGNKSLRILGAIIWNTLPFHVKSTEDLESFKAAIKN